MNFNQKAKIYEKISISQQQAANKLLSMTSINKNDIVLDVGCGSGYLTELVKKITPNVSGFDISENMIQEAKHLRPNIKFFIADADIFCEDNSYDWIITNAVTYYFKNLLNTFKNFYISLKTGGKCAIQAQTEVTPQFLKAMDNLLNETVTANLYSKFKLPINQLKLEDFIKLLENVGFQIENAQMINFKTDYTFEQAIDIFKSGTATPFLNPIGYGVATLPQKYINKFWKTVKNGIKNQCVNSKITLDVPRCFIIAKKI